MDKKYFSIREVADKLKVRQSTLRFWEKEIKILNPSKSAGGTRRYVQKDIDLLEQIKFLIEEQHLTLAGVNERLSTNQNNDEKRVKVIQTLKSIRHELNEIRKELNGLDAFAEEFLIENDESTTEETTAEL